MIKSYRKRAEEEQSRAIFEEMAAKHFPKTVGQLQAKDSINTISPKHEIQIRKITTQTCSSL